MTTQIEFGNIKADVVLKDIKNVHLNVLPPNGRVRISAPAHMKVETIRIFAISKLDWIKQQQRKIIEQERETPREFIDRESHYVWGKRYLMTVIEIDEPPQIKLKHDTIILQIRPGMDEEKKQAIVEDWYRDQIRNTITPLREKWERIIGVRVNQIFIQHMKTKWGGSNPEKRNIRINTELAKKPPECLEYILVHEMVHLKEPTHNENFIYFMDQFMPRWKYYRELLNQLPLRHEEWEYGL
jgi:predicted metal-dependent hydrolase